MSTESGIVPPVKLNTVVPGLLPTLIKFSNGIGE